MWWEPLKAHEVMYFWIFHLFLTLYSGSGYPLIWQGFFYCVFIEFFKPFSLVSQKLILSIFVLFKCCNKYNKIGVRQICGQMQRILGKHEARRWGQKCPSVLGSGLKSRCGPWPRCFTFGMESLGPCSDPLSGGWWENFYWTAFLGVKAMKCFHSLLEEDVNGAAFCVLKPSWDIGNVFVVT